MAVHKVPQDVEAEDKFLGPLTFKQFLFAGGTVVFGYLSFLTLVNVWIISPVFILPTLAFAVLAFPWSKEQPSDVFLGSRIRFFIVPRRRVWDQTGLKQLVNITVPKRAPHVYTDGLDQSQVHSRLSALATMVDSRGWASRNITQAGGTTQLEESDRLVEGTEQPKNQDLEQAKDTVDVLDPYQGDVAKQFDQMIQKSEAKHKADTQAMLEHVREEANQPAQASAKQAQDFWFMNNNQQAANVVAPGKTPAATTTPAPQITKEQEEELMKKAHEKHARDEMQKHSSHEKILQPMSAQHTPNPTPAQQQSTPQQTAPYDTTQQASLPTPQTPQAQAQTTPVPDTPKADILNLASNNDLSVETLSRQAKKNDDLSEGDEVVVSLH